MPNLATTIRWRLLLGVAVFASIGVVLWVVFLKPSGRSGPFWDKYEKVQLGMTENEVNAILGSPNYEDYPGGSQGPYCFAWFAGEQTIAVDFNLDGRATEKRFRPSHHLRWVRERLPSRRGR